MRTTMKNAHIILMVAAAALAAISGGVRAQPGHPAASQAGDPVAAQYRSLQSKFFAAVGEAEAVETRVALTRAFAADLNALGSTGRGDAADRCVIESSVYYHFAGEAASADRALGEAIRRTGRDTSWENKMLLLQALQELPDRTSDARRVVSSFIPEAKTDPARSRELADAAEKLGLRQEAAILRSGGGGLRYETAAEPQVEPAGSAQGGGSAPATGNSKPASRSKKDSKRKAFDFQAKVHQTGRDLDIQDYRGRFVLIDFWATWCGPCVADLPHVKRAYKDFHSKGFEIVGVSLDNNLRALDAFIQQNNMPWPQVADGGGWKAALAVHYGIKSIPATVLLDPEGNPIANNLRGEQLYRTVEQVIRAK